MAGRYLLGFPYGGNASGVYFWEHCFWVDTDDFPNDAQMFLAIQADMKLIYTNQINVRGVSFYLPGTNTLYFRQNSPATNMGNLPAVAGPMLLTAARWRMRSSDGVRTYHLHRQPVGESYIDGDSWTSTGRSQSQTRLNTFMAQGIYRSKSGALLTEAELGDRPVGWQLRHGTKRRNQKFWLP